MPPEEAALSPAHCSYEREPAEGAPVSAIAPLRAGVAEVAIDLPVGTPLGAYTGRATVLGGRGPDARHSPHARAFAPSVGVQTRPLVRALYLAAGSSRLLLLKADLGVAFDRLVYDVEQALDPTGGLRGRVIVATSHTHAGWGTFQGTYHLALGFDLFQESQYQRLLASLVRAGREAMAAAQPARLGAGVWDGWDERDEIFSDRREEDDHLPGPDGKPAGKHKDGRLLVVRIDDASEQPLAVLFHFPIHGTIGGEDNPLASVDAPGHVELLLEEHFDRPVLALHLQGPAGDASPRGRGGIAGCDSRGRKMLCANFARMESVGELAAPRIYELWTQLRTAPEVALGVLTRAVPNGREISVRGGLHYAPYDENRVVDSSPEAIYTPQGTVRNPITQFNVPHGAGLCGGRYPRLPVRGIEGASGPPYGSCVEIEAASRFVASLLRTEPPKIPDCTTTRTTLTAVRLGAVPFVERIVTGGGPPLYRQRQEDLLLVTLPGEPVSLLAAQLRHASPAGPERTFVLGYAQGHMGYILGVENWLAGGYEPSINIYGPLEGEWLMERALELARAVWSGTALGDTGRPGRLVFQPGPLPGPEPSPAPEAGRVPDRVPPETVLRTGELPPEAQPAPSVPRVIGRATFLFYGGDPSEDLPEVVLEREEGGRFVPVRRRSGRLLDGRGREMVLIYTPLPPAGPVERHLWAVEWQAVGWDRDAATVGLGGALSAPIGRYRFVAQGRASGRPYRVESRPFSVVADGVIRVQAGLSGGRISGRAIYPVGAGYRLLRLDAPSDGEVPVWGPLTVRVESRADGTAQEFEVTAGPDGGFVIEPRGLDLRMGARVTVRDRAGNRGFSDV